ncbi:malate synthase A [Marihabitans asiaticum]|uniref:Malate synthase n=1 Tax=Marihabitans asiaticum TaxID=415218 RepID=A0A560WGG7_9MICO|nr:malate synthase A [Marihabitans asiaticum]TWD16646.1 malate synthase [Marihabitans asiaticum]
MNVQAATRSAFHHVVVKGEQADRYDEVITPEALDFLRKLHRKFAKRRHELLDNRFHRDAIVNGLHFREETAEVREDPTWHVAEPAPGLADRRVEITGPLDPGSIITALNSEADVFLADFEDGTSPSWANIVEGQLALRDAIAGRLRHTDPVTGAQTSVGDDPATIMVRPRGLHLLERHITVDSNPIPGGFVDVGLYLFHNAQRLIDQGSGPYFYLPKLEGHLEARLWNDLFVFAQDTLGIPQGTIRATVLIETIPAAFEMEEILYELRDHAAGLNAGRWDYMFSVVKNFGTDLGYIFPDRHEVTMEAPFMKAYTELLVRTCHKRGAHAIGGMAAMIPTGDAAQDAAGLESIRAAREAEAKAGFDGAWVTHPGLIEVTRQPFTDAFGDRPNQIDVQREDVEVKAEELLAIKDTPGQVTAAGVRTNVFDLVRYLNAWLDGTGIVAIDGIHEDAAMAEISRAQLWQWIHHGTQTKSGETVTIDVVGGLVDEAIERLDELAEDGLPEGRADALRDVIREGTLEEFLPGYITEYAYRRYLQSA